MPIPDNIKLRLITWSVIGISLFHLFLGSYDHYPFIHWTMFSDKEHRPIKSRKTATVVIAIHENGQEQVIEIRRMVGSISGSGGTSKAIQDDYFKELLAGNRELAVRIARVSEARKDQGRINSLRMENWTWTIDSERFLSGEVPLRGEKSKPDRIRILNTIDVRESIL